MPGRVQPHPRGHHRQGSHREVFLALGALAVGGGGGGGGGLLGGLRRHRHVEGDVVSGGGERLEGGQAAVGRLWGKNIIAISGSNSAICTKSFRLLRKPSATPAIIGAAAAAAAATTTTTLTT